MLYHNNLLIRRPELGDVDVIRDLKNHEKATRLLVGIHHNYNF